MARCARKKGNSGYYHIILRGVNKQAIFCDDMDRRYFLKVLRKAREEENATIAAYCLMTNHVHILMKTGGELGAFVKSMAASYVYYFNRKNGRTGHLFQERFKSEPVDSEAYFVTVFRYILRNPEKAGICPAADYPWSSWKEILSGRDICDIDLMLSLIGGKEALLQYLSTGNNDQCLSSEGAKTLTDQEAVMVIKKLTGLHNADDLKNIPKVIRDPVIVQLKEKGLSNRCISRISGLSRYTVAVAASATGDAP